MNQFNFNIQTDEGSKFETPIGYLFGKRHIFCFGEINSENSLNIITQINVLCSENDLDPITIHIDSPGGDSGSCLAIYDAIMACPCQINTICHSVAASAASVIFVAGEERTMYEHSKIFIHNPYVLDAKGSAQKLKSAIDGLKRTEKEIVEIYSRHTKLSKEKVIELMDNDTTLKPEEAEKLGFATKIVARKPVK